ncbi:MAG: VOC family protein [Proteobacteria bacterium]|nr:VOC family protein [Pseudomonadota bacterium]
MTELARLDHTVINVRFEMDRAEGLFGDLGFSLTERGYHSLGSVNHLMMFGSDYLELIGLPPGMANPRADIAEAPLGINGLVFKTVDVDATFAHLQALDMAGDPPKAFTRPVKLPDGEADAAFRTVAVRAGIFPGGRVYYCEHGTPELVWRPEWQSHGNGARAMPEFVIASTAHEQEAENLARLLHSEVDGAGDCRSVALAGGQISVMTPAAYGERYGALASPMAGRPSIFGAVVFRTGGLDKIRHVVAHMANPAPVIDEANRVVLREPTFDSVLEFIV